MQGKVRGTSEREREKKKKDESIHPHNILRKHKIILTETREYYAKFQPFLLSQPSVIASKEASVLEENFTRVVKAMERENEWAAAGLENLEEYQRTKRDKLFKSLGRAFGNAAASATHGNAFADLLNSFVTGDGRNIRKGQFERATDFGQESSLKSSGVNSASDIAAKKAAALNAANLSREAEEKRRREEEEEAAAQRAREEALDALQDKLNEMTNRIASLGKDKASYLANISRIEGLKAAEGDLTADLEKEYTMKKQTLEMLPDASNNIKRLQGEVANQAKKMVQMNTEFESFRQPLVEEQRKLMTDIAFRKEVRTDMCITLILCAIR